MQFALQNVPDEAPVATTSEVAPTWLNGDIPFYMLSVARRPRSLILIDKLLNEFLPQRLRLSRHDRKALIQGSIDRMVDARPARLRPMQGGFYWIPHQLHEKAYKQLSDPVSWRRQAAYCDDLAQIVSTVNNDLKRTQHSRRVDRLVFVSLVHSMLSRFYYLHVFRRTRDATALYEYLYHRLSSLRYLKLLNAYCAGLRAAIPQRPSRALLRFAEKLCDTVEVLFHYDPVTDRRDTPVAGPSAGRKAVKTRLDSLEGRLRGLRCKLLQAMLNVFDREADVFVSYGSADTWIAWVLQIETDLKSIVSVDQERNGFEDSECQRLAERMRLRGQAIGARLYRDKRHWRGCLQLRGDMLERLLTNLTGYLATRNNDLKGSARSTGDLFNRVKELLNALLASLQTLVTKGRNMNDTDVATEAADIVSQLRELMQCWNDSPARQDLIHTLDMRTSTDATSEEVDAFFASLIDVARCLRHLAPTRPIGFSAAKRVLMVGSTLADALGEFSTLSRVQRGRAQRELRRRSAVMSHVLAFERHRLRIEKLDCWSQTPDPDLENHRQQAIRWHRELTDERHRTRGTDCANLNEFFLHRCQFRNLQAQCLLWLGHHRDALDALNNAETGLTDTTADNRSVLALIWEHRAHTMMRIADSVLRTGDEDRRQRVHPVGMAGIAQSPATFLNEDEQRRRWHSARGRLGDAAQALGEAEKLLRCGRRVTGQWIRLYSAKAQLEIEELLLTMGRLEFETYERRTARMRFLAEIHNILHRGLEAFRGGWDCVHAPGPSNQELVKVDRAPWLAKWAQLMIGGYVLCYYFPDAVDRRREQKTTQAQEEAGMLERHEGNKDARTSQSHDLEYTKPIQYASLWQSLNDSVGMERLFERDSGEDVTKARWFNLIVEVEKSLDKNDSGCTYMRELALAIMTKTVCRVTKKAKALEAKIFEELVQTHCTP
jgi:hypothetical protein